MHGTPPLQSANSKKIGVGRAPASGRKHRGPVDVALRVHLASHHPFQYALCLRLSACVLSMDPDPSFH